MVMAILPFAYSCSGSLLVGFMKIPEKGRYIMVCNLSQTGTTGSPLFDS
jgi:hypothetical protein